MLFPDPEALNQHLTNFNSGPTYSSCEKACGDVVYDKIFMLAEIFVLDSLK